MRSGRSEADQLRAAHLLAIKTVPAARTDRRVFCLLTPLCPCPAVRTSSCRTRRSLLRETSAGEQPSLGRAAGGTYSHRRVAAAAPARRLRCCASALLRSCACLLLLLRSKRPAARYAESLARREMYFVVYGTCEVENEDGRAKIDGGMLSTIEAGSFFGELALIQDIRRTTTVRARTTCDITILTRADLVEALDGFPEVREMALRELLLHRSPPAAPPACLLSCL